MLDRKRLLLYSRGLVSAREAMADLGLRNERALLDALASAGLEPPTLTPQVAVLREPVVVRDAAVGRQPVHRDTRVEAEDLFAALADGRTLDQFLAGHPEVDREEARVAVLQACASLMASAPDVTEGGRDG